MVHTRQGHAHLWQFGNFSNVEIRHFVTDRHSFGSDSNISFSTAFDPEVINRNRALLKEAMRADKLFLPKQVHLTNIVRVTTTTTVEQLADTDALITNEKSICIAVMSADCVPILLYDKKNAAVGAVHSGWRGTVAHILLKTLNHMNQEFGTIGDDVLAAIGPSVCQQSYEVGEEVIDAVGKAFPQASSLLQHQANGKAKLDLCKANAMQLMQFGVPPSNIEVANLCTVLNNQSFYSARKGDSGRFAAGIMLS